MAFSTICHIIEAVMHCFSKGSAIPTPPAESTPAVTPDSTTPT